MKLRYLVALVIFTPCAFLLAFSPGFTMDNMAWPAVTGVVVASALALVLAPPWLKSTILANYDHEHQHMHSQAIGLGAGGRHGWPRSIVLVMLAVWAMAWIQLSRVGQIVAKACVQATSTGHALANHNTSAQPLPS